MRWSLALINLGLFSMLQSIDKVKSGNEGGLRGSHRKICVSCLWQIKDSTNRLKTPVNLLVQYANEEIVKTKIMDSIL